MKLSETAGLSVIAFCELQALKELLFRHVESVDRLSGIRQEFEELSEKIKEGVVKELSVEFPDTCAALLKAMKDVSEEG
jgi:hypothetical protein